MFTKTDKKEFQFVKNCVERKKNQVFLSTKKNINRNLVLVDNKIVDEVISSRVTSYSKFQRRLNATMEIQQVISLGVCPFLRRVYRNHK